MSQQERDLGLNNGVAVKDSAVPRHCEERTGRANARPMTGSATKQSSLAMQRCAAAELGPLLFRQ